MEGRRRRPRRQMEVSGQFHAPKQSAGYCYTEGWVDPHTMSGHCREQGNVLPHPTQRIESQFLNTKIGRGKHFQKKIGT